MDDKGYILRLYENQGLPITAKLSVKEFKNAWYSNMNEDVLAEIPIIDETLSVSFGGLSGYYAVIYLKNRIHIEHNSGKCLRIRAALLLFNKLIYEEMDL